MSSEDLRHQARVLLSLLWLLLLLLVVVVVVVVVMVLFVGPVPVATHCS